MNVIPQFKIICRLIGIEKTMLMDDSFYYDENGVLQGVPHPNPDYLYPNLFYQGITRVREKIALVIVNSPRLFEKISSIFDIEQEA